MKLVRVFAALAGLSIAAAGCGSDAAEDAGAQSESVPTVVVSTNILGDVVENLVGDELEVVTIMPVGADPHDFQPSASQVAQIGEADVLIINGADFEEGLLDVFASAEADGVPVYEAMSAVDELEFADEDEHEHADEDEHADHDHGGVDPHFFTDPARMAVAAEAVAEYLVENVEGIDGAVLEATADAYVASLVALDSEVEEVLSVVPEDERVLVTSHEVFGYFADRYGFEVAGTVIPGGSTTDGANAQELAALAELIEHEGVPAIFGDISSSDELVQALSSEVGDIEVVSLFSESLGDSDSAGSTYIEMVQANAQLIAEALAG